MSALELMDPKMDESLLEVGWKYREKESASLAVMSGRCKDPVISFILPLS